MSSSGSSSGIRRSSEIDRFRVNEEDWVCADSQCGNVNFARRTSCNRCGKVCDDEMIAEKSECPKKKKLGTEIGKAAAEKSGGLFSADDWQCSKCGNVNWARRQQCNMCNAPKFGEVEERTGYGGGYNERENVEYIEREDSDGEYDEFGRRKKVPSTTKRDMQRKEPPSSLAKGGGSSRHASATEEDDDEDDSDEDLSKYDLSGFGETTSDSERKEPPTSSAKGGGSTDSEDDDEDDSDKDLSKYDLSGFGEGTSDGEEIKKEGEDKKPTPVIDKTTDNSTTVNVDKKLTSSDHRDDRSRSRSLSDRAAVVSSTSSHSKKSSYSASNSISASSGGSSSVARSSASSRSIATERRSGSSRRSRSRSGSHDSKYRRRRRSRSRSRSPKNSRRRSRSRSGSRNNSSRRSSHR